MSKKMILVGLVVGIWVALYAMIQTVVGQLLGFHELEIWPVLMAPGLVALLGGGNPGMIKYYKMGGAGILAGLVFVLADHALVPIMGAELGVLLPLALIIMVIVCLQAALPTWVGPVTFVTFCASTIQTDGIVELTIIRLVLLLVCTTIFLFVEHKLVSLITKAGKKEPAESTH